MRDRLASLGFQMHFEPLEYKEPCLLEEMEGVVGLDAVQSKTTSSYTGEKSAETLVNTDHSMSSTPRDRPLKRQRMESPIHGHNIHAIPQQRGVSSRDKMPPPAKPLLRMKSFKKLWPTLRKKASHGLASSSIGSHRQQSTEPGFGISHSENDRYDLNSEGSHMTPTLHAEDKNDDQYMTGALPVESYDSEKLSPQPIDLNGASADFTFRKPVEASSMRPAHLPSEPSYIRLLDGLSNDTGLDLGITDPRSEYLEEYEQRERDLAIAKAWAAQPLNPDGSPRWCLFEALDQHAMGSSSPAPRHPDPLRSNPIKRPTSSTRAIRSTNRTLPATPAPQRSQQHAGMEESVVSPFFKSSNCSSRNLRRAGVNQRGDSSRRNSGAYPYQRQQTPNVRTGRGEGRSLNVLSFFNSPLNTRNEPILHHTGYVETNPFTTSERRYAASNVTANGYIKRPDREPVKENSFLNALGRNGYILPSSTTSFAARALPPKRTVVSRPAPLSASVQSIVSSQHGGRRSRGGYIHSGIRSSRISLAPRNSFHDNPYAGTEHNIFSSCGRRTIRR